MEIPPTTEESSNYDAGIAAYYRGHYEVAMYDFEQRAVVHDDPVAQFCLGYMYKHGLGVHFDPQKAIEWYTRAAEQGYAPAQNNLGVIYLRRWEETALFGKEAVKTNFEPAIEWLGEAAKQDNPTSQFNLALASTVVAVNLPEGSKKSMEGCQQAVLWYKKSAEQGYTLAQNELGRIYQVGLLEVDQDSEQALQWYLKAVSSGLKSTDSNKRGYALAQQGIGMMYAVGDGVNQDFKEAVKWYEIAAAHGNAEAQYCLGLLSHNGDGVNQDFKEAVKWYEMAARQNHTAAQNSLALMYREGNGVSKNTEMAWRLAFASAQQGDAITQANLGKAFEIGLDEIPQSDTEAYYWYSLAINNKTGLDSAEKENVAAETYTARESIKNRLSQDQRKEIQKRVGEWKPRILKTTGTGFYISKTHILTNAHVVDSCDELRTPYHRVKVIAVDEEIDLALLFDPHGNTNTATFRSYPVDFGEEVAVFGYPLSNILSYRGNGTSGIISGLSSTIDDTHPDNLFQHTAPMQGGNSGGPILDSAGNVVGVVVSSLNPDVIKNQNVNFAIKFNVVKDFLEKNNITNYEDPISVLARDIDPKEIYVKAEKFTIPVLNFVNKPEMEPLQFEEISIDGLN